MKWLLFGLYYMLGGAIASFVSTQINAQLDGKSNFLRSSCWKCNHPLNYVDLIPTFGYLIRKGHCHYCSNPINVRYLYYEIIFGLLSVTGLFSTTAFILTMIACSIVTVIIEICIRKVSGKNDRQEEI